MLREDTGEQEVVEGISRIGHNMNKVLKMWKGRYLSETKKKKDICQEKKKRLCARK